MNRSTTCKLGFN